MSGKQKETIYSSLEYGYYTPESSQFDSDGAGKTYDICDELDADILDYRLKKISYILNKNQYIDKIKIEYIKKTDNTSKFMETPSWDESNDKMEEVDFEDDEEITNLKAYLREMKLVGFEITTNKGKNKKIGFGEENEVYKENLFESGKKTIIGFGFNSSKKFGVYSMHFYYLDKN